jgi:hypothetical protein
VSDFAAAAAAVVINRMIGSGEGCEQLLLTPRDALNVGIGQSNIILRLRDGIIIVSSSRILVIIHVVRIRHVVVVVLEQVWGAAGV